MTSRPPPLAALRAFAAAGRLQSLRDAAAELHVTASAVSHHVRLMEAWVGAPLFVRSTRQVRLTDTGRVLSDRLNLAFGEIGAALQQARGVSGPVVLRISALPLFTSVYLIPRLQRFEAAHPDIVIQIETSQRVVDFDHDPVDLAIRNVGAPTPGLTAYKLMDLRAAPLCSPDIAAQLTGPEDLTRTSLVHNSARPDGWAAWLAAQGLPEMTGLGGLSVDTVTAALDLAAHGRGVALGIDPMIWDAPQMERLVIPFASMPVSAGAYYLVHRRHDANRAPVQAFARWLRLEIRRDAARYARLRAAHGIPAA